MSFRRCLNFTLEYEGGYVNHPADPGGPTNMGITQKVYEDWVGYSVEPMDIAMLTVNDVFPIYKEKYWKRVCGDQLPDGLNLAVFDFAVNSGSSRASKYLQSLFPGLMVDGVIGPITLSVVREDFMFGPDELIDSYCDSRLEFLNGLSTFTHFGRGWTRRVEAVRNEAKRMK